MIDDVWGMILF